MLLGVIFLILYLLFLKAGYNVYKSMTEFENISTEGLAYLYARMILNNPSGRIQNLEDKLVHQLYLKRKEEVDEYILNRPMAE